MLACRGFCYFNSVAIAAKLLQQRLHVSKTLVVDWVSGQSLGSRRRCWAVWTPRRSRHGVRRGAGFSVSASNGIWGP